MADLDDTLTALAKIPGAEALAKKALNALKEERDEKDAALQEAGASKKALKKATADLDQAKKDVEAATSKDGDALKKATAERDDWKKKAEDGDVNFGAYKRRNALADELGIMDATRRAHAVEAAYKKLPETAVLDENGKLKGATKFVRDFYKGASFYWTDDDQAPDVVDPDDNTAEGKAARMDKGNGGRPGVKKAMRQSGTGSDEGGTRAEKVDKWSKRFGHKADDGSSAAKH